MTQILAIFKKDVRHLWPEILASLAILAALVIDYPITWRRAATGYGAYMSGSLRSSLFTEGGSGFLTGLLVALVPTSWLVLAARVVHTERLVGSTQFWLTRPYEWPKLLAAKALFLVAFVSVPFFVAQSILLAEAGFHPFSYVPGLLYCLLIGSAIVLLLVMFSTLTSGFGRLLLVLLGLAAYVAAGGAAYSALPFDLKNSVPGPFEDLSLAFLLCGCATVVLIQYARRRTLLAWALLGSICVALTALAFIDPDRWLVNQQYPQMSATMLPSVGIAYAASPHRSPITATTDNKTTVEISIPVEFQGIGVGTAVSTAAFKATIQTANGPKWVSPWLAANTGAYLQDNASNILLFLDMRRATYDRFKSGPVTLRLSVAINLVQARSTTEVPVALSDFSVPGFGICAPRLASDVDQGKVTWIVCRAAMRRPPLTHITASWSEGGCPTTASDDTIPGSGWAGSTETGPAEFGITPVWEVPLVLSNIEEFRPGKVRTGRFLCPGSQLLFTTYGEIRRAQTSLTVQNLELPSLSTAHFEVFGR